MTGGQKLRLEAQRTLFTRLLGLKFGPLPTTIVTRIETASMTDIEQFSERMFTASTLDELLAEQSPPSGRR